ncbi:MAG: SDR family NAD(P)-dependent oxidoreductase [Dehalococcoidia bacterium]|nr:SDR family NAD(P)-dependent oxidoreductase [Dehalococcoidia bacterium]
MAERPLEGKVAIITGAGSPIGIGHAITLGLARAGARVVLTDINQEWLAQTVGEVREICGDDCAIGIASDVTDPQACQNAVDTTITQMGGLNILVNNAGTNPRVAGLGTVSGATPTNFWENSPEAWSHVVAVNLSGNFYMARAAVVHMLNQGWGRIIGVTTSMDTMWRKGGAPYGPSKAGHEALVAIMAQELEGTGVTANILVPGGATYTNMTYSGDPKLKDRLIHPEAMQKPAVWLASDDSGGFNGRRIIAYNWDDSLPLAERLEECSAPAAWPQLGQQAIRLNR